MAADKTSGALDNRGAGQMKIWTIGHSTHSLDEFVELLRQQGIALVVDVRTVPRSRHVPQFNQETLSHKLPAAGIEYIHLKELGGLRHARPDSPNTGWRNASFRGYADYMQTPDFAAGLEALEKLARRQPAAIMCAEGVPWRCHRSLISDALQARGWQVVEIMPDGRTRDHPRTEFARVEGDHIVYPPLSGEERKRSADGGQETLW